MNTVAAIKREARLRDGRRRPSRPGHGLIRVNPKRMAAYALRTMTRPQESWVLTARDRDLMAQVTEAWRWDRPEPDLGPNLRGFYHWRATVETYAKAKGLGRVSWMAEERMADLTSRVTWRTG